MANFEQQSTCIRHFISFGNPLLDHSFRLDNEIILLKYGLKREMQDEMSTETIKNIIKDAHEMYHEPDLNAGGSALNTCKILRQIGHKEGLLFCGAIGDDDNGKIITELINECRVSSCMDIKTDYATGVCVCLITGDKRSLHASIGAAGHFSLGLFETDDWKTKIEEYNKSDEVSLFYIEGYFIPGREDVIKFILNKYINRHVAQEESPENATDDGKLEKIEEISENPEETPKVANGDHVEEVPKPVKINPPSSPTGVRNLFATNLNAAYIVKEFSDTVKLLVESADLIFGNREEFEALASIYEGCQTIQDVVQHLMRKESELDRLKIFVITDGSDPVAVYYGTDNDFRWHRYRVPFMPSEKVVDTTGAGDSFIAGFLYKFMSRGLLADCVANGCEVAGQVVQNIGCNLR
ncbi:adenosine kinase [Culicoides brevitarsis]|uniref:adenosine kinase n=1 Tax=Culicoides brevitarsis TaxID=469753 RepID=UPI00307BBA65